MLHRVFYGVGFLIGVVLSPILIPVLTLIHKAIERRKGRV